MLTATTRWSVAQSEAEDIVIRLRSMWLRSTNVLVDELSPDHQQLLHLMFKMPNG